jgi:CDP-diacylglycerol pyrophosphatase
MSFNDWVDERISKALTDERIKLAVDEAVLKLTAAFQIEVGKIRTDVKDEIDHLSASLVDEMEKLPGQIGGQVNDTLNRIEASIGGLQQFLNGLPHIPFLQ